MQINRESLSAIIEALEIADYELNEAAAAVATDEERDSLSVKQVKVSAALSLATTALNTHYNRLF